MVKSYLTNVNSTLSDFQPINIGIPQGSILGPVLFIFFVNCLPCAISAYKPVMYADDTSFMYKAMNECELQNQLNSCLNKVAKWFDTNKLTLNVNKTKFMVVGTKRTLEKFTNVRLIFNNYIIERVDEFKYLGVKLDSNLSWKTHIDYLCKNVSLIELESSNVWNAFFLIKLMLCYQWALFCNFHQVRIYL